MNTINGRPPKKIWEASLLGVNSRFTVKILAVNEEKALKIVRDKFPRMTVLSIVYYGEIYK